jgi:dGTPase
MSAPVRAAVNNLRDFMFENVYYWSGKNEEVLEATEVIKFLFEYYCSHPDELPSGWSVPTDSIERQAVDFISGMTDRYALRTAATLGCSVAVSAPWQERLA